MQFFPSLLVHDTFANAKNLRTAMQLFDSFAKNYHKTNFTVEQKVVCPNSFEHCFASLQFAHRVCICFTPTCEFRVFFVILFQLPRRDKMRAWHRYTAAPCTSQIICSIFEFTWRELFHQSLLFGTSKSTIAKTNSNL